MQRGWNYNGTAGRRRGINPRGALSYIGLAIAAGLALWGLSQGEEPIGNPGPEPRRTAPYRQEEVFDVTGRQPTGPQPTPTFDPRPPEVRYRGLPYMRFGTPTPQYAGE